jgi:hypothetical protein
VVAALPAATEFEIPRAPCPLPRGSCVVLIMQPPRSLCILTPSYRGDLAQFAVLRESIRVFAPEISHVALVHTEDYRRFRKRFQAEPNLEIVPTAAVLPREIERRRRKSGPKWLTGKWFGGRQVRGWHAQQLAKIFALASSRYEAALFVDSDVFICRPLQARDFYVDGRLKLFRQRATNAEQLGFDISTHDLLGRPLHTVTDFFDYFHPACFRRWTALGLLQELSRRRGSESRWMDKFLQERRPSEYNLLGYAATVLDGGANYELIECKPTDLHHCVRFPEDLVHFEQEMRHMLAQPKQFALIQSTVGIDPARIATVFRALVDKGSGDHQHAAATGKRTLRRCTANYSSHI